MQAQLARGLTGDAVRRRVLLAAVVLGLAAAGGMLASVLAASYRDVSRDVSTAAANLASAVSQNVDRNIELLDLSMQAITAQWNNPAVQAMDPSLRDAMLFDRAAVQQEYIWLYVMDGTGKVVVDAKHKIPPGSSFGDRDYFRVHILSADVGLFVSKPYVGRVSGMRTISLSRRISNPDGSFGGVVVAAIEMEYLSKLYRGLNLGSDGSVTLLRTNGRVMTREPSVDTELRDTLATNETFQVMRSSRAGSLEGPSPVDGKTRIISFHRVGSLPLIQDVEISVDQAYANWWRKTAVVSAIMGGLGLSLIVLLIKLDAELSRRVAVEAELEWLVATDPLTQIANRRRFQDGLEVEWRRSIREGLNLSVLMIDADAFKRYNDTYGHPAGDGLLKSLAACIAGSIRRPGDLAARYGGEEFVVLLPNTDAAGALNVAEAVRAAVVALAHPHAAGQGGIATVSIGVASMEPMLNQPSEDLVAKADEALYRAKADGRNCVRAAAARTPALACLQKLVDGRIAVPALGDG